MIKFIVLCATVCLASAKPGIYGEHPHGLAAEEIQVPAAVSSSYRRDVIHKPVVTTYTVPEVVGHKQIVEKVVAPVEKSFVVPPVVHKTFVQPPPIVEKTVVHPASIAHTYRRDIIGKPVVSIHSAPFVAHPVVHKTIITPSPIIVKKIVHPIVHSAHYGLHHSLVQTDPWGYVAPLSYNIPYSYGW